MVDHAALADVLVAFSRNLVGEYEVHDILDTLCDRVAAVLPVRGAGIMLEEEQGVLRFVAASDAGVHEIESLQIELGEGPCLRAYQTGEQVIVPDLTIGDDFPSFGPEAVERGLRAVFSFPMRVRSDDVGAINLYCDEPRSFGDEDRAAGQVLADIATTYILNARSAERSALLASQLQHALDSRVPIEQAKGKLSEQLGVPVTEAFARMRSHARSHGAKLREVAQQIVDGTLRL